ncbi:MAG: hypothetical protein M0R74_03865 [Dehalococcoidia bacterium]|nr:hypothetical protein [Dehalococcoidia bacterium]
MPRGGSSGSLAPTRSRRQVVLLLLVVLLATAGLFVLARFAREGGAPADGGPEPGDEEEPALVLARRFAPIYYLRRQERRCDNRGEPFDPSPVELVLGGRSEFRLRDPGLPPVVGPGIADVAAASDNAYLDFPGDPRNPGCRYERDFRRFSTGLVPTVYARIAREPERSGFAVQYWAFYYFNNWNNTHEGDWEMVQLVFEVESVEEALQTGPAYAVYAQHSGGERKSWDDKHLRKVAGRPAVYPSVGSHASYFQPNTYLGLGEQGTGLGCDISFGPHRSVVPSVLFLHETPETLAAEEAWLTFPGRWGQRVNGAGLNGPTGPQTKRAWHQPMSWADDARTGSATLPGGDLLGVNAVHRFCSAIEIGSEALRAYLRFPVIVGGSLLLVLGTISAGGLVVLRDLTRSPLVSRETSAFLRHRRSLGQMIRAATIVYLRRPQLFLGIPLGFIPLNLLISSLQPWLLSFPPFDYVMWVLGGNQVSQLLLGLLVGGIASFAVYLFVVSGAIAAVRALDEGRQVNVRGAYRAAFYRSPHVLLARFRTLIVLALLGFSLVGLPFAIWLGLRWFFVEEAVILDDQSHWRAPGASSHAVEGQWLRAFLLVLFFGVLGALAGPLLAFGMLLGTDTDPTLVNAVAGLFHTAFLPFTAIGLCMAFRDLQVRKRHAEELAAALPPRKHGVARRTVGAIVGAATWALHRLEGRPTSR